MLLGNIVAVTHVLVLVVQPFSLASTKYFVVEVNNGVVKMVSVASQFPAMESSYQLTSPDEAVARSKTEPGPLLDAGTVDIIFGVGVTNAVIGVLGEE